jgi:hypothetical protein
MQESSSLFIDYPDKSWSWDVAVPAGKRLTIEYVSGSLTKKIGSTGDQTAPPFPFTVTTTAGGQAVSPVLPVLGVYTSPGVISVFRGGATGAAVRGRQHERDREARAPVLAGIPVRGLDEAVGPARGSAVMQ